MTTPKLNKPFASLSISPLEVRQLSQPEFDIPAMISVSFVFSTVATLFGAAVTLGVVLLVL